MHSGGNNRAVLLGPTAHPSERRDERPPELGQGIFDSNDLQGGDAPCDQSHGFEVSKVSCEHALRHVTELAAQLAVSIRSVLQRKQNSRGPPANKNRADHFQLLRRHLLCLVQNIASPVPSVAIRNTCVPTRSCDEPAEPPMVFPNAELNFVVPQRASFACVDRESDLMLDRGLMGVTSLAGFRWTR